MIQSLLFRLIIVIFAISIITNDENSFSFLLITTIIVIYIVVGIMFKLKQKDVFRLIWDFIFINIVIYEKDVHNPMIFLLVLTPIINAINYTGKKTHITLLLLLTITTLLIHNKSHELWFLTPIFSLLIIYISAIQRYKKWQIDQSLTKNVDSYFTDPSMLKPHQIYEYIIRDLNTYFKFKNNMGIQQMATYTLKGDMLWLVSSSTFLWNRTLDLGKKNLEILKEKKELKLDDNNFETYYFYIKMEGIEYVFTCITYKVTDVMLMLYRFKDTIKLAFIKMSKLLITEYRISERREKKFNEIKDNVLYVNQAVKTMHFIRNKLNPLTNLIAYHMEADNMSQEVKDNMQKIFNREVKQASKDLLDILNFANYLLDKSKNPFHGTDTSEISLYKIYIILSEIAERYIGQTIEVDESVKAKVNENLVIKTNLIECKIMFTDWINNMKKYSNGHDFISMKIDNQRLIVHFENMLIMNTENIDQLVKDMNSKDKDAVLEGKNYGYGIYIIKSIAHDFGIDIHASKRNDGNNTFLGLDFKFMIYERK